MAIGPDRNVRLTGGCSFWATNALSVQKFPFLEGKLPWSSLLPISSDALERRFDKIDHPGAVKQGEECESVAGRIGKGPFAFVEST